MATRSSKPKSETDSIRDEPKRSERAPKKATKAKASKSAKATIKKAPKPPQAPKTAPKKVTPKLVQRGGVVYPQGCDAPVWRLEMARRAGATTASLLEAFSGLTPQVLALALFYAQQNRPTCDKMIRKYGAPDVAMGAVADTDVGFDLELDELLDRNAELYRRLAQ